MDKNSNFKFYTNRECEYFPCHSDIDEEAYNCKFCYCPLYALGAKCGGNFVYIEGKDGPVKDCTSCTIPHQKDSADYIESKFTEISMVARENNK